MEKPLGDSGLTTHKCDGCGGPVILAWRGVQGEYCSNACYEQAELNSTKERKTTMAETSTPTAPAAAESTPKTSKASAPKPEKKATSKPEKKPASKPEKKATPKPEKKAEGNRQRIPDDAVIHLKKGAENPYRGIREKLFRIMKDGMTIGDYKTAMGKVVERVDLKPVKLAVEDGLVTISGK